MKQLPLEALFLSLRIKNGVYLEEFKNQYDCDLITKKEDVEQTPGRGIHLYPEWPPIPYTNRPRRRRWPFVDLER